jgi:hypothetical protein
MARLNCQGRIVMMTIEWCEQGDKLGDKKVRITMEIRIKVAMNHEAQHNRL